MKAVFALVTLLFAATLALEKYSTKYDNVDVDNILHNQRLYNNYIQCILKKGRCTEEGKFLQELIPDAIITECSKCSDKQKEQGEKVIRFIRKEHPKDWDALIAVYDPEGKYQEAYKKYLDKV
uniref:Chemosensory protein 3 n=1 Tax=Dastarcus helophoroides TaxID=1169899 RepID=A0A1I9HZS0_9CUCU|nr:chemosensory protein 3 [Dastarcus helophoroides]